MRFKVIVFVFLVSVISSFAQDNDNWFYGKPIRDIVFTGLNNISSQELSALMNPYKGRIFDDNLFWEIQGKLYALEYFDRIDPSIHRPGADDSEVVIRFNVVERPVVGRIIFNGNSGVSRRELNDVILTKVNDIFNRSKVRIDIEAITNKYLEKGYPNVVVTSQETVSNDSTITVIFNIEEHERISISRIEFQGNSRFSANTLRNQLSLKQRSLGNDGAFQEAKLLADRAAIIKYYRDRGYINAQIRDVTRTYETDARRTNLILTFHIDEGQEFKFGGVTFEGNIIFSSEQLSRLISSRVGDTVNMTRLETDLQRIADLYFENGYIYNAINRSQVIDSQTNTLSYNVTIVERGRAYIENIVINGNIKTKDHVILREIPLEPGDVFSYTKIMDALRNLYNLQFFSVIIPDMLQGSTENLMDLIITVEEQPTTDIQIGLTFSGSADPESFPISGVVKWNDNNLMGSGNQLGVEVNSSIVDTTSVAVNYMQRWAFGLPLSLGFDFSANYSKHWATMNNQPPLFYGNEKEVAYPDGFASYEEYKSKNFTPTRDNMMRYDQWYLSLGLSTGYSWLTSYGILNVGGGVRFGVQRISYDGLFRPFDPVIREEKDIWTPKNSLWLTVSLDQRDVFYDPSRGYYAYQRLAMLGILGNEKEHYFRSDTKTQIFFTLFDLPLFENWNFKAVLGFNAAISFLFNQPGRTFNPAESNRLVVDGMFVGRGWRDYTRGYMLIDTWAEIRIPLAPGILAWDFFFDAAGVDSPAGSYFKDFTIENMRFGYGGGIRFTIPQFPIRLSLAKRFKVVNGEIEWQPGALFGGMDLVISFALSY